MAPSFPDKSVQGIINVCNSSLPCIGSITDKSVQGIITKASAAGANITNKSVQGCIDVLSGFSCAPSITSLLSLVPANITQVSANFIESYSGATNSCLSIGFAMNAVPGVDVLIGTWPNNASPMFLRWGPQCTGVMTPISKENYIIHPNYYSYWSTKEVHGSTMPGPASWKTMNCNSDGSDRAIVLNSDVSGTVLGQGLVGYPDSIRFTNSSVKVSFMVINGASAYSSANAGLEFSQSELLDIMFTLSPAPTGIYRFNLGWTSSSAHWGGGVPGTNITFEGFSSLKIPTTPYS